MTVTVLCRVGLGIDVAAFFEHGVVLDKAYGGLIATAKGGLIWSGIRQDDCAV